MKYRRPAKVVKLIVVTVFVALAWTTVHAFSTGPDPGHTNAPGDVGTCINCHDSFELNVGPGTVSITGVPAVYESGKPYPLTVTVRQGNRRRWGFQLTALTQSGDAAGTLVVTDPVNTRAITATVNGKTRDYVEHTQAGTRNGTPGGASWTFTWTAPAADLGPVSFYYCGNAANGDNTNQEDYVYSGVALANSPSSQLGVRLIAPTGGETVTAGSVLQIEWETTNSDKAESQEIKLSTDGGTTFPTRVASALPPTARSFAWQVPATLETPAARVRVEAYPKGGLPPTTSASGTFAVVKPSGLTITNVSPATGRRGEKLTVVISGNGFTSNSTVDFGTGSGVKIKNTEFLNPAEIRVVVKIKSQAVPGPRDVRVATPQGATALRTKAFLVQ